MGSSESVRNIDPMTGDPLPAASAVSVSVVNGSVGDQTRPPHSSALAALGFKHGRLGMRRPPAISPDRGLFRVPLPRRRGGRPEVARHVGSVIRPSTEARSQTAPR